MVERMQEPGFQRARSTEAKHRRETAILEAAGELGAERGIRQVTLTDIAAAVGMRGDLSPPDGRRMARMVRGATG
jgi:AcrR family transcriptional regulator